MRTINIVGLILVALGTAAPAAAQSSTDLYQQALRKERAEGDLLGAIKLYEQVARSTDRTLAARAVLRMGEAYEQLGRKEALSAYRRLLRDYADQKDIVSVARTRLSALEQPALTKSSGALAVKLIWEGPRIDTEGRPSPDGRYLSFVDWWDHAGEIVLRDLSTGETRAVTKDGDGDDVYPLLHSFSQDGKRIAYFWNPRDERYWRPQLKVINTDGTGDRLLIANADRKIMYLEPSDWTPDGRHVLVSFEMRKEDSSFVALVSATDGSMKVVKRYPHHRTMRTSLSPDGKWAALDLPAKGEAGPRDLFVIAVDGSSDVQIENPANDLHPVFSPDGNYLLFSSDRDGSVGLWGQRLVNGKPQGDAVLIKGNLAAGFYPLGFAGDVLYYAQDTGGGDLYTVAFDQSALRVNGAPSKIIQQYQGYNTAGYWSADGSTFAYASRRNRVSMGQWATAYVRNVKTGADVPLRGAPGIHKWFGRVRPSPDGTQFAMLGEIEHVRGVYLVDLATGTRRGLATFTDTQGAHAGNPEWSRDGKSVYYATQTEDKISAPTSVVKHDLVSNTRTEVVRGINKQVTGSLRNLVTVSPDERHIAYGGFHPDKVFKIFVATIGNDEHREIVSMNTGSPDVAWTAGITFTPDGKHILFARAVNGDRHDDVELMVVPVAGGEARSTGLTMPSLRHISFAPDGRLTFAAGPIEYKEVWTMENLLPRLTGK